MGTWGMRIYEDDTALDIRHDFLVQRAEGVSVGDLERMAEEENIELGDQDYNDTVWLALCCVELETGTLTDKVKAAALEVINSGRQYELWLAEAGKDDAAARKRELTLIRKYIDRYDGKPVKRKSWVALQKDEAAPGGVDVAPIKPDEAQSSTKFVRGLPLRFWGFAALSIVAFMLSAACFWYVLFGS